MGDPFEPPLPLGRLWQITEKQKSERREKNQEGVKETVEGRLNLDPVGQSPDRRPGENERNAKGQGLEGEDAGAVGRWAFRLGVSEEHGSPQAAHAGQEVIEKETEGSSDESESQIASQDQDDTEKDHIPVPKEGVNPIAQQGEHRYCQIGSRPGRAEPGQGTPCCCM